jgi:DNA-binding transcriptional regulator YhcF (GntR family)
MPFQSIEPRRLYRQIAEQIRGLIRSGEYRPGARLPPERDLAKQLGVSRPSVREALIALEVEGLVEVRIGSGIYVHALRLHAPTRKRGRPRGRRSVRAAARASRDRERVRRACGEVGEEGADRAIEGRGGGDAARDSTPTRSRLPEISSFTSASPRRRATARSLPSSRCCGKSAPAVVQAARAPL